MSDILKHKKIRKTPFREEVLQVFNKHKNAISSSVIEEELLEFDRITLYRTIKLFLEKGIIHEIKLSGKEVNYALCSTSCNYEEHNHQHIHFNCEKCNKIFCVEVNVFPKIELTDYVVKKLEIQVQGVCKSCE